MTSIARQRDLEEAQGLRLRRRYEWGARFDYTDPRDVDEPATRLFLHITITNPDSYLDNDRHAQAVEAIGISRFPSTGISYNVGIMPNGAGYEFQPIGRRGAHTVNDFERSACSTSGCPSRGSPLTAPSWNLNVNSRAVVLCQNVADPVTRAQIDTTARIAATWKRAGLVARNARWHGHRCVSAKGCPGDKAWAWMDELDRLTEFYTVNGLEDDMPLNADDKKWIKDQIIRYAVGPTDFKNLITAFFAEFFGDRENLEEVAEAVWRRERDDLYAPLNADGSRPKTTMGNAFYYPLKRIHDKIVSDPPA